MRIPASSHTDFPTDLQRLNQGISQYVKCLLLEGQKEILSTLIRHRMRRSLKLIVKPATSPAARARGFLCGAGGKTLVVLPRIGSHIGQDAQLVDVRIVLRVESFQLRMKRLVAGARQTGIAVVDADVRIADLEVGHVVVAGKPRRHGVGDLVGLGLEALTLDETAQRF